MAEVKLLGREKELRISETSVGHDAGSLRGSVRVLAMATPGSGCKQPAIEQQ